ncbi:MAG: ribokinase [Puniceicoccaceae bacterium]
MDNKAKREIWVIGSSNVDMIMKMERLPEKGETVTNASFMQTFGGKGANSAVAAARAGGNIKFMNCMGNDVYAPLMLEMYANEGMDVSLVRQEKDISSGTALVMIGDAGMNYLSVAPGANYKLTPELIDSVKDEMKEASRIVLQCEIPTETNLRIIELADQYGIPVQLNLAPATELPMSTYNLIDTLIVNENEARFLLDQLGKEMVPDDDLAQALQETGAKEVIVTLGADGGWVVTGDKMEHFPAFPVEVVDTTAAGDTFCGAYAVAVVEGMDNHDAVHFASAAASLAVSKLGAIPSVPKRQEIDAFVASSNLQ